MSDNPRVFISYSHRDDEYAQKVLAFCNKLRSEGIDANIDLYEESPSEGWPRWMENQIRSSDFVIVLCDKSYNDKFYSDTKGKGVVWEVSIVYQFLYDSGVETKKFLPAFFESTDSQYIPTPLKQFTYYNISNQTGYEKLYWRLRGVSTTQKPALGKLKPLPEKEQKAMFISSPIDLEKWNAAGWTGTLYMFYPVPGHPPALGLIYKNYSAAIDIFSEWQKTAKEDFADDFIRVDFIVPPFPKNCWVNTEKDHNNGVGYFIHIGPNIEESIKRGVESGIKHEDMLLATISRYQWMEELNGSRNRELFTKLAEKGSTYLLLPIGIKDASKPVTEDNMEIGFDYGIFMKKAHFTTGVDITDQDLYQVVLEQPKEK